MADAGGEWNFTKIDYSDNKVNRDCNTDHKLYEFCDCDLKYEAPTHSVMIYVVGRPILTKPKDVDFQVEIYDVVHGTEDDGDFVNDTTTDVLKHTFVLAAVQDHRDLERMYGSLLAIADKCENRLEFEDNNIGSPRPTAAYYHEFKSRVQSILNPPEEREQNENPHVKKKKGKGKRRK